MKKRWWFLLFVLYAGLVALGTMAIQGHSFFEWIHILVPPGRIRELLVYPLQHHHPVTFERLLNLVDSIANILLFFPLGIGIFLAFRSIFPYSIRKILLLALFIGLLLSIGIEIFQYTVPKRIPSVSDVIANTGGAVFGCYFLYFRRMWKEKKTQNPKFTK